MPHFFHTAGDGTRYKVHLVSLLCYETEGGSYDDSANGGEKPTREEFVGGIYIETPDGEDWLPLDNYFPALFAIGVPVEAHWYDSTTDWHLLRAWPKEAPIAACMVNFVR